MEEGRTGLINIVPLSKELEMVAFCLIMLLEFRMCVEKLRWREMLSVKLDILFGKR